MDTQAKKKELEEKWRNFKKISENEMLNWFAIDSKNIKKKIQSLEILILFFKKSSVSVKFSCI